MGRFSSDQNRVALLYESGTYGNPTGLAAQWLGQILSHDVTENENMIEIRHIGTASRNVDSFVQGPIEVDGTITYRPQDFRGLGLFLGSIVSVTATYSGAQRHNYSEVENGARMSAFTSGTLNPFVSFQLEDSKTISTGSNFVRTVRGCNANTFGMTIEQGTPIEIELGYIAQTVLFSSGAATTLTASTIRPFLWSDTTVQLPGGTTLETIKTATFTGENGIVATQYVGSGRTGDVPAPLARAYSVEITKDMTSETAKIQIGRASCRERV